MIRVASRIPLPRGLRQPVFGRIAVKLGIDLTEAERVIGEYRCFGDIFVRRLNAECRPIDRSADSIVSPVDGSLSAIGTAEQGGMIQAKGINYRLEDLLRSRQLARQLEGGAFITLYLSPRDYHRVHCPLAGRVTAIHHISGTLLPVKPYMVNNLSGLFARNERIVFELQTELGTMALVCVAAAGVGNISVEIPTPGGNSHLPPGGVALQKGDEMAVFNLGSTVILVFEPGRVLLESMRPRQQIRMGQVLARSTKGNDGAATGTGVGLQTEIDKA